MKFKVLSKINIFLIPLLILGELAIAQHHQYLFSSFNKENGLSNNNAICFLNDSKGFIWIGTTNGLNRYDGNSFKVYKLISNDSSSLRSNLITRLEEDYNKNIWIGAGGYLEILNPKTSEITHTDSLFNGRLKFVEGTYWKLREDKYGNYWYSSSFQGLYKYLVDKDSLIKVIDVEAIYIEGIIHKITDFSEDKNGFIWCIDYTGKLYKIHNNSSSIVDSIAVGKTWSNNYQLFIDSENIIWCYDRNSNNKGIRLINPNTKEINIINDNSVPFALNSDIVTGIGEESNGNIWISTDHGGLNIFNRKEGAVQYLKNNPLNNKSVAENAIVKMYFDHKGYIWLGTYKKGVSYYHKDLYKFNHYKIPTAGKKIEGINDIDNFTEDKSGNLWIGTNGGGLIYYNKEADTYTQYKNNPNNPNSLSADVIIGLITDRKGNVWAGTYLGGLNKWDGSKFTQYKSDSKKQNTITDNRIWDICEDDDGRLWLATLLGGVNVFNPETEEVERVLSPADGNTINSPVVFTITKGSDSCIWFGTVDGLQFYDKKTKKFGYFRNEPGNRSSLSDNIVYDILEDSRGLIWAGTSNGLNILNTHTNKFIRLNEENGLTDNRILTILEDKLKNIWVATSNGVSNIIVHSNQNDENIEFNIINYSELDGLQGAEFNEKSAFKSSNGELYFGGSNGFNIIIPENINEIEMDANIVFTDFLVFNESYRDKKKLNGRILFPKSIPYTKEVTLNYNENVFTIVFSNLNYIQPKKQRFQYKLEGFNNSWLEQSDNKRRITYTNLDPGEYKFTVRVNNNDGSWNNNTSTLEIIIYPPWWSTWWFRILLILFIISLILLIFYLRLKQLTRQKKKLESKVTERTNELTLINTILEEKQEEISIQNEELNLHRNQLEELVMERTDELNNALIKATESDKLKTLFINNMSHEIRTPMNAVMGFAYMLNDEDITEEERRSYIEIIQENSDALLVIVNDLLDLSKIEANHVTISKSNFNVNQLLIELESLYKSKAKKELEIGFVAIDRFKELIIHHDKMKIKQVLQNLIDNAVKFTKKGHVKFWLETQNDKISFFVEDTGIGISPEDKGKVFEAFSKIERTDTKFFSGVGLGLTICKRIAELMSGNIDFKSSPGKGTTFEFSLPVVYENGMNSNVLKNDSQKDFNFSKILNVLIAEDEPNNYLLIEKILKKEGALIDWARNGQEAVNLIRENSSAYNLILMDIKMPVLNGIEAFKTIRKLNSKIPVIAVTAFAHEKEIFEFSEIGFNGYVSKPLKPKELLMAIRKVVLKD